MKKILIGALVALLNFGVYSVTEAQGDNGSSNYRAENYCCSNYYARGNANNNDDCCDYGGGYCCR